MASDRMSSTDWRLYYEAKARAARLKTAAMRLDSEAARLAGDERAADEFADLARGYAEDAEWNDQRSKEVRDAT